MNTHTTTRRNTIRRSLVERLSTYFGSDLGDSAWSPSERALRSVPHFLGTRG